MIKRLGLILIIFSYKLLFGQAVLFEDKNNYISDLKVFINKTKNQNLINQATNFESNIWSHPNMDDINKQKITEISSKMYAKGFLANAQFSSMMTCIDAAIKNQEMGQDKLLHFFETLIMTIDYQELSVLNTYFQVSTLFFQKRALYDYYNNSCKVTNGTFDFIYAGTVPYVPQEGSNSEEKPTEPAAIVPVEEPIIEDAAENSEPTNIFMSGSSQPTIEGPSIKFENIHIDLNSKYDSARVQNTSGSFLFSNRVFVGSKGKFDWSLLGQEVAEIYVNLKEYNFSTTNNILVGENVEFFYPSKLPNPVLGLFEFKSIRHVSNDKAVYPRFTSLTNNVELTYLHKYIVYTGGYSLEGKRFSSKNLDNKPASLFYNDGKNRFQTFTNTYNFGDSVITSDPTEVIIFLRNDSIWHPGVSFTFFTNKNLVRFHRDRGVYKNSLWHDTYHKLEFSVDLVTWDLASDSLDLNIYAAKSQIPAMFKSMGYFSDKEFTKLQSINSFHPLRILFGYMQKKKTDLLYVEEILKVYKNVTQVAFIGAMQDLKRKGFVDFELLSGQIVLKPKAYHYMLSFDGKSDFDGIYIPSFSPVEINATVDTKELTLKIRGVEKFFISDSSNVYAMPENKTVKILQNREILFDGNLVAGIFDLKGKNFRFNYEDFLVSMEQIDTIKFIIQDEKDKNKKDKSYLDNSLVYASGTMYVNKSDNKSGKISLPEYPKFDATTGAYVYFNKKEILGGAYTRSVYFKIPPFKTDSVKGSDRSAVRFDGEFFSGDILPIIKETLKVMPDNSMGFKHKVPLEGYDVFGGKAKFFGTITLDHQGIRGDGELHYLSSKFYSNDFVFYGDSVLAVGQQAKMKEQKIADVYFPEVDIADYEMKWVVRDDSLHLININYPFEIYKKQITLEGTLNLTPKGLFGSGMMEIKKVNVIASHYDFKEENVEARHAVFNNKLPGNPKPSISVNNMKINFYLKESYADLNPEIKGMASLEFPMNEFKTSIENARWQMEDKVITMDADENELAKSFFYATSQEKDSLAFNAKHATYDMVKNEILITGVPEIKVADCLIIPDSNQVTVFEGAQLKSFKEAIIVIDTINKYHRLEKGKIEINSRTRFAGNATYKYAHEATDTMTIVFENFATEVSKKSKKDSSFYTTAVANISPESSFYIAHKILYQGKAKMKAIAKNLEFDGKVKIDLKVKRVKTDWFPYKNDGTSNVVTILLDQPVAKKKADDSKKVSEGGTVEENIEISDQDPIGKLYTGLYYESGSNELYSNLVSTKRNDTDEEIIAATGQLIFDNENALFKIGSSKRLKGETKAGNLYTYSDSTSLLTSSGKFTLSKSDANFGITTVGEAKGSIVKNSFSANLLVSLKMNVPSKALEIMSKKILEIIEIAPPQAIDSITIHEESLTMTKLANLESEKVALDYDKNYTENAFYKPLFKYSSKLSEGICLGNVHMNWSNDHKAWHNKTHVKVSNIFQTDINHKIKGYLEIKKSDQGDVISLFLHPRSDVWFFINYQPGRLSLLSSETDFVKAVTEKSKGETGTPTVYSFVQSDFTEKQQFLKEFYKNYLGKEYNEEEEEKEIIEQVEEDPIAVPMETAPTLEAVPDSAAAVVPVVPVKNSKPTKKEKKSTKKKQDELMSDETPAPVSPEQDTNNPAPVSPEPVKEETNAVEQPTVEEPVKEKVEKKKKEKKAKKKSEDELMSDETPAPVTPEQDNSTPAPVSPEPVKEENATTPEPAKEEEKVAPAESKKKEKKPKKKENNKQEVKEEQTPEPVKEETPEPVNPEPVSPEPVVEDPAKKDDSTPEAPSNTAEETKKDKKKKKK